jgi:hypothetical protein
MGLSRYFGALVVRQILRSVLVSQLASRPLNRSVWRDYFGVTNLHFSQISRFDFAKLSRRLHMFELKSIGDLEALLRAGASFSIDASIKSQGDLVKMASATAHGGGTLTLRGLTIKSQGDLIAIASAGKGNVHFTE